MHNFTKLVRGQAPQPGAYHNVLRMRRWLVSLDSPYGVKDWQVGLLPIKNWQVSVFALRGLAGLLLAYQGACRYTFSLSRDWQVHVFALHGLKCTFCLSRDWQVHFLPFEQMAGTLSLPLKDWQVHFMPVDKACTSICIRSVLMRDDCKLA